MISKKNELATRIANGDHSAESELFTIFKKQIATIIQIRVGLNNPDWEDIFSETQATILIKLRNGSFDPYKGDLLSYIYGITINKIREYFNSKKRRKEHIIFSNEMDNNDDKNFEQSKLESKELRLLIENIINSLKDKYKRVIYLRYYQELSISEIAEILQIEPRRVSERINYAIKLIQKKCKSKNINSIFGILLSI